MYFLYSELWDDLFKLRPALFMFTAGPVCSCAPTRKPSARKPKTALKLHVWEKIHSRSKGKIHLTNFGRMLFFPPSFFPPRKEVDWAVLMISFWTSSIVVKGLLLHHMTWRPSDLWKIFVQLLSLHIYEIRPVPYICFNQKTPENQMGVLQMWY